MSASEDLARGARDWLATAQRESGLGNAHVAFEAARHAAELASKSLLAARTGAHPREHAVAHALDREGLTPPGVDRKRLHNLLAEFTLGTYGFDRPVHRKDLDRALRIAEQMVAALERRG